MICAGQESGEMSHKCCRTHHTLTYKAISIDPWSIDGLKEIPGVSVTSACVLGVQNVALEEEEADRLRLWACGHDGDPGDRSKPALWPTAGPGCSKVHKVGPRYLYTHGEGGLTLFALVCERAGF